MDFYTRNYIVHPETIYIGGGNPSLVPFLIRKIMKLIDQSIKLDSMKEYTIECNPVNITDDFIKMAQYYGVNRISVGVQSFSENSLKKIMREKQNNDIVYRALDRLNKNQIDFSIDMIIGLPQLDNENELKNLEKCVKQYDYLNHVSLYFLSIDNGSYLFSHPNEFILPSEERLAEYEGELFHLLQDNAFKRYEVSNWARNKKISLHNKGYWLYEDYIGMGPSAHGKIGRLKIENKADMESYLSESFREVYTLSKTEFLEEYLLMGLRLSTGIGKKKLYLLSGEEKYQKMNSVFQKYNGYLFYDNSRFILNEKGWDNLNQILIDLFLSIEE